MNIRHGSGGYQSKKEFTDEQKNWATSNNTLKAQVGFSLKARTEQFKEQFNEVCSIRRFRRMYKEARIT